MPRLEGEKRASVKVELTKPEEPGRTEIPCSCGGTLVWGPLSPDGKWLTLTWNRQSVETIGLFGYKCTNPNCSVQLLPVETAEELRQGILRDKGK
jgi:hypothetical protein